MTRPRSIAEGSEFELRHFHVTLEEGGTTYKNDQTLYNTGQNPEQRYRPCRF